MGLSWRGWDFDDDDDDDNDDDDDGKPLERSLYVLIQFGEWGEG